LLKTLHVFVREKSIGDITRKDCRDLRDNVLEKWPINAKQNFPGKTVKQVLKANKKKKIRMAREWK